MRAKSLSRSGEQMKTRYLYLLFVVLLVVSGCAPQYVRLANKGMKEYVDNRNPQKAIEYYNESLTLEPNDPIVYIARAAAYNRLAQYQKSIDDYSMAIQLDPKKSDYYNKRAYEYAKLMQYDLAIDDYSKAISLLNLEEYRLARGKLYALKGMHQKAIEDLDQVVTYQRTNPEGYYVRGLSEMELGQTDKAVADFDIAIKRYPKYAEAVIARGDAYLKLGKKDEALKDYKKSCDLGHLGACDALNDLQGGKK
jgi:tetratricopeptide (TPR) repeat protein